ncbi:MAG: CBS domain-containing protein [Candidatus Aenigmarchaeota archaeon]|nr:CBS domain-containing protein [Candidatus Aenigmarchaeota archaeon]MCX8179212.1 CBS domain-containing protein [Candidatus Aenigmarchaeota archaeon]
MKISKIKPEKQESATIHENIFQVSKKMGYAKSIVIVDEKNKPVGIITVRDIVTRVLAKGKDPKATLVKDVMTTPVFCVSEDDQIEKIVIEMLEKDYLTVPVVDKKGKYKGILTLRQIMLHRKKTKNNLTKSHK